MWLSPPHYYFLFLFLPSLIEEEFTGEKKKLIPPLLGVFIECVCVGVNCVLLFTVLHTVIVIRLP